MRFLLVTDLHYCKDQPRTDRYRDLSAEKLRGILRDRAVGCDLVVDLGDTADAAPGADQAAQMEEIAGLFRESGLPAYCAIGNHDTSMPKPEVCRILGMPGRYYAFETPEYLCLVLDGSSNDPLLPLPEREIVWDNTWLDEEQLAWLARTVDAAQKPILVFCHELFLRGRYENTADGHVMKNRDRAMEIFARGGKVKAVFCGHCHDGDFVVHNGIPYLTFRALCLGESHTCAVVTVENGIADVKGFGLEPDRRFALR